MIPKPQGFTLILEPVDRERIEQLTEELRTTKKQAFSVDAKVPGYEHSCPMRVVAAGPGMLFEQGFIQNHIFEDDIIQGTLTEISIANDFLKPKEHWEFDGQKYIVTSSRDYRDTLGPALFIIERSEKGKDYDKAHESLGNF